MSLESHLNTDYVIQIKTKHGRTTTYLKEKNGWSQTASTGIVRQLSGDQLLSHLLPPLAGDQPSLSVTVERRRLRRKRSTSNAQHSTLNGKGDAYCRIQVGKENLRGEEIDYWKSENKIRFHPRDPRLQI